MESFFSPARKFTLAHPDVFYTNGILESFLETTANLIANDDISRENFVMKFVNGRPEQKVVDRLNLQNSLKFAGEDLSFKERLSELGDSNAILFIQRGAGTNHISEKFYELLALKKKVLAVVPNPIAYEEIEIVDPDVYVAHIKDLTQIADTFLQMYRDWKEEEERSFTAV